MKENQDYTKLKDDTIEYLETNDENNLRRVATFVLLIGIGISILSFIYLSFITVPHRDYPLTQKEYVFNPSGFIASIGTLMGSILLWSLLRVISNISISLKELNANYTTKNFR